jgi:hypothetical protein
MNESLYYALGMAYIVMFLVFAARLPRVALALCFGLGPIQRSVSGLPVHITIADLNLVLTFSVFCLKEFAHGRALRWGPMGIFCLLYLIICFISSVADWRGPGTAVSYVQMIPYLVCAVILFASYGDSLEDLRPAFNLLMVVGLFFSLSVIAAFSPWIYGMHKNGMGSSLACIAVMEIELWLATSDPSKKRLYFFCLGTTVLALLITLSRGAWLGAFAGFATILILRRDTKTLLKSCVTLIPLIALTWFMLPAEDKIFATGFEVGRNNIALRLDFIDKAWTIFKEEPILGAGVGLRKEMDALNVVMMALAETGVSGLIAFGLIHVALIRMAGRANDKLRVTSWTFSCLAIGTALMMTKLVHAFVDHYWSRGCITIAWAGAGIATRAYFVSRQPVREPHVIQQLPQPAPRRRMRISSNHVTPWPKPGTQLPPQT